MTWRIWRISHDSRLEGPYEILRQENPREEIAHLAAWRPAQEPGEPGCVWLGDPPLPLYDVEVFVDGLLVHRVPPRSDDVHRRDRQAATG
jgi:hypothetical protein